jgi:hypothetical protein
MKKITSLIIWSFFLFYTAWAQPQRLAVIPGLVENTFSSVCIDYFADIPAEGQAMEKVMALNPKFQNEAVEIAKNNPVTGTGHFSEVNIGGSGASSIKQSFLVGTADASSDISANYMGFIENRITYFKSLKPGESHQHLLQEQIWQYDVLNHLGYIRETGKPLADYENAMKSFEYHFGSARTTWGESRITSVAEGIKSIDHAARSGVENSHFLFVSKNLNSGEYIAFDHLGKPIFNGKNKTVLIDQLNASYRDGDNVFIEFDENLNENNRKAFMTDFETRFRIAKNKEILVSENNDILFSNKLEHTLVAGDEEVKLVQATGADYYRGEQTIKSGLENFKYGEIQSVVVAISPNKSLVRRFFDAFRTRFDSFKKGSSLANYINSTKKMVENTMGVSRKDLMVIFSGEGRLSYFTKKNNNNPDFLARK